MLTQKKYKDKKTELSIREKLALIRKKLKECGIDAFLVPHNDMYFNEITAPYHNRLEWITGFTGSAGFAIILKNKKYLFVDGRYSIQAKKQSGKKFKIITIPNKFPKDVIKPKKKIIIGFDPKLFTQKTFRKNF